MSSTITESLHMTGSIQNVQQISGKISSEKIEGNIQRENEMVGHAETELEMRGSISSSSDVNAGEIHYVKMLMGERGYSAYEIAVQQGFEGTIDQWLQSLQPPVDEAFIENVKQKLIDMEVFQKVAFSGSYDDLQDKPGRLTVDTQESTETLFFSY